MRMVKRTVSGRKVGHAVNVTVGVVLKEKGSKEGCYLAQWSPQRRNHKREKARKEAGNRWSTLQNQRRLIFSRSRHQGQEGQKFSSKFRLRKTLRT